MAESIAEKGQNTPAIVCHPPCNFLHLVALHPTKMVTWNMAPSLEDCFLVRAGCAIHFHGLYQGVWEGTLPNLHPELPRIDPYRGFC